MGIECLVEVFDNVLRSKINYEPKYNSMGELLLELLGEIREQIVLVDNDSGRQWTANQLRDAIITLGVKLSEEGISKGEVVAFFAPNSDLHAIAMLSVWSIGAVYTGLIQKSPLYKRVGELKNIIAKTNATYLVGSKETIDVCNEHLSSKTSIKKFFAINEYNNGSIRSIYLMLKSEIESKEREMFSQLVSRVKRTDLCKIGFSSGTTGEPKAVTESHGRYISYISVSPPQFGFVTSTDTTALIQPLPHVGGSITLSVLLLNRAKVVVFSQFNVETYINDCVKHSVTLSLLVPAYLNILNRSVQKPLESSCLKKVLTGGEFLPKLVADEFVHKFKPHYFSQIYGCTEAGWVTGLPISYGTEKKDTAGIPFPGCQVKVVDRDTAEILGANKLGEICMKGPEITDGYLDNEEANRASFDKQSFFKSGDIGYFDDDGYIYIIDRIKEVIKYNSQQVSPTELQNILMHHEAVKEAAVVGITDEIYGQLPKAFVVINAEFKGKINENELVEFLNSQVMDFKKLRGGMKFMSELPKTSLGKIDRKALKAM